MKCVELDPSNEPASPAALGDVFRVAAPWLQENGSVDIGQILDPSYGDDQAPGYEFDGGVVCDLLPETAATLDISPDRKLLCRFFPAYSDEDIETGEQVLKPPECTFYISHTDDPIVECVMHSIALSDMDSDEWLGEGVKETEYRGSPPPDGVSEEELFLKLLNKIGVRDWVPPDPITTAECEALLVIANNLGTLKQLQDGR